MIVVRPNVATFEGLKAYVLRQMAPSQLLYADQTGLMCYFHGLGPNRTRTLPCSYVYDMQMPTVWPGLRKYETNCRRFGGAHLQKHCLAGSQDKCMPWSSRISDMCSETISHVSSAACSWRHVAAQVRAVHFKGRMMKPWPSARAHGDGNEAKALVASTVKNHSRWLT